VHHCRTLLGHVFAAKACIDSRKKNLLNSSISSTCPHNMVHFSLLMAETSWRIWGTPANLNGFSVLALHYCTYCTDVTQRRSTKLCTMFGCLLTWYAIHIFLGPLPPNGILPGAKFTLRPRYAYYIGSVTALHSSSGHQLQECNYRTFAEGATYVGHRSTF